MGLLVKLGLASSLVRIALRVMPYVATITVLILFMRWYMTWLLVFKVTLAIVLDALARVAVSRLRKTAHPRLVRKHDGHTFIEEAQSLSMTRVVALYLPSLVAWVGVVAGLGRELRYPWWFATSSIGLALMLVVAYYFTVMCFGDKSVVGERPPRLIRRPGVSRRDAKE